MNRQVRAAYPLFSEASRAEFAAAGTAGTGAASPAATCCSVSASDAAATPADTALSAAGKSVAISPLGKLPGPPRRKS